MKRSSIFAAAAATVSTLLTASPALAQPYDDTFGLAFGGIFLFCWGIVVLVAIALWVLNIWMLVDVIGRQEYEFPGSTGNSKNLWLILLVVGFFVGFGWIVALVYYFQVYKKVRRGSGPPSAGQPTGYNPPAPPVYQTPPAPPAPPEAPAPPAPAPPPSVSGQPAPPTPPRSPEEPQQ